MYFKIYSFLVLLLVVSCTSTQKKDVKTSNKKIKMNELIIHIKSAVAMQYKDSMFIAKQQHYSDAINTVLENKKISVTQLTGMHNTMKTDAIFRIFIDSEHSKEVLTQLQLLDFVTGAYIKPEAEEPDLDDLN